MKTKKVCTTDFRRIRYWIDDTGKLWSGPHCPYDNLHFMDVKKNVVVSTYLPECCVEITPRQAVEELRWQLNGI